MRRFRFQLAGLERLLTHREDDATLRAAQAAADRHRAEGLLGHLEDQASAVRAERRGRRTELGTTPQEELLYEAYFERMGGAIDNQRGAVAQAAEHHKTRLGEVRDAATRRRVIGLLHERRRAGHRREALREINRFLDEVGSRQHATRRADAR